MISDLLQRGEMLLDLGEEFIADHSLAVGQHFVVGESILVVVSPVFFAPLDEGEG